MIASSSPIPASSKHSPNSAALPESTTSTTPLSSSPTAVTTSSHHHQKSNSSGATSSSKDHHNRDERLQSVSPYHAISVTGVGQTVQTVGGVASSTNPNSAPSLYVSVPLSTANVHGINLPSTTTSAGMFSCL